LKILIFLNIFLSTSLFGSDFGIAPKLETTEPVFIGGGINFSFREKFEIGASIGRTSNTFNSDIAKMNSHVSGVPQYKSVVEAAFQKNKITKYHIQYNLHGNTGWRFGVSTSKLDSSGTAGIDEVLAAATGKDYTALKNFLIARHKPTDISLTTKIYLIDAYTGYSWKLINSLFVELNLGVSKVVSCKETVATGYPVFETTVAGKALMSGANGNIESIVKDYGITPTLGFEIFYKF
jgi:hypothetical protein